MAEAEKKSYTISDIYQGGYSSLDPEKGYGNIFTGYRANINQLAITTNPSNAAILKEFSDKANLGVEHIEIEALDPKVFDAMPKQQLKEINRLSKLTGVGISFHGPLIEPSGMTQHGWNEASRKAAERQIQESMERIHEANPEDMVVNFHTSNFLPSAEISKTKEGEQPQSGLIVDTQRGSVNIIPLKERYFPGENREVNLKEEIKRLNEETWNEGVRHLAYNGDRAISYLAQGTPLAKIAEAEKKEGKEFSGSEELVARKKAEYNAGVALLNDSYRQLKQLYELSYKSGAEQDKKILEGFAKRIESYAKRIEEKPSSDESIMLREKILEDGLDTFNKISPPQIVQSADEFMMKKSSESFGNAAFNVYKKFSKEKKNAPIMVIENPPANQQFSRGEDVANMVKGAREQFVERALKEGFSRGEAERQAEKLIGATWDVGHINMLRKQGFEEKDIIKETEKIAPFVKHIHLSDNFGFEHTELPMGMGNVPLKEIMEKLGKKGFEAKKIIEAGDWWTKHLPQGAGQPFVPSLEGMGSPIYGMKMAPYWNQALGLTQGYFGGYGQMLPQGNYEIFGAGFSQLPAELGGQRPGAQGSRMSGKPME